LKLNDIKTDYTIHNIAISPVYRHDREIYTGNEEPYVVSSSPTNLPQFDVVDMDCEGAKLAILNNLSIKPRLIIVETHFDKQFSPYSSINILQTAMNDLGDSVSGHGYVGEWGANGGMKNRPRCCRVRFYNQINNIFEYSI